MISDAVVIFPFHANKQILAVRRSRRLRVGSCRKRTVTNILKSTFLVMIDGSQQTRTWNQMIFLVITFKFRLSAVRICLPSKLVISLPRTFKCKSNIKNQELSLITPDTTDAGSHKRAKTSPFSWARPSLSFNLTAPTYPEKVLEDQRASKAPDRLPEHHWVRLYSTQLWPSQAADARAGPSLSDWSEVIRHHWSRERENDSWLLLHQWQ